MTDLNQQMIGNQVMNNINTDNAIADILSNLSDAYIYHIVMDSINMRFRPYSTATPNIPYAFEQNFKVQAEAVPSSQDQIAQKRTEVYSRIIEILCNAYNLSYTPSDYLYSDAFYLYNFLVSDFTNTVVLFFLNYILREKKHIYDDLNLSEMKKNKDSSTLYSKKIYSNAVIATIHANIVPVLANIAVQDISLQNVLDIRYSGTDATAGYHISHIVSDNGDFFKSFIGCYAVNEYMPDTVNAVKLALQSTTGDLIKIGKV